MTPLSSGVRASDETHEWPEGISVIVCAHNAATRIGQTLRHLARQRVNDVPWEIILVDNASTDGTAEVARREWPVDAPAPLRLFHEPTLGYNHAADCGIANARYRILAHVHDDTWLAAGWLARVAEIFRNNSEIGACGGPTEASFECAPPHWFGEFQENYAVGPQWKHGGDITWSRGYLWGAGLCVRRTAWMKLKEQGFQPLTSGRRAGARLISGEDSEVCYALRLAGWRLWYSEDLCLTHYMQAARLDWRYLRRLVRSFGAASVLHDCYLAPSFHTGMSSNRIWRNAFMQSLRQLLTMRRQWPRLFARSEGNSDLLALEREIGRALELIRIRHRYAEIHQTVLDAQWRKLKPDQMGEQTLVDGLRE